MQQRHPVHHRPAAADVLPRFSAAQQQNDCAAAAWLFQLCTGDEQGQILGSISAVQALGSAVGPFIFNQLFAFALQGDKFPSTLPSDKAIQHWFGVFDLYWVGIAIFMLALALAFTVPVRTQPASQPATPNQTMFSLWPCAPQLCKSCMHTRRLHLSHFTTHEDQTRSDCVPIATPQDPNVIRAAKARADRPGYNPVLESVG